MEVRYYPTSDMLNIELAQTRSIESEEIYDGFVFDFDADGRVVSIEVDNASQRVNLELIRKDPRSVIEEADHSGEVSTAAEMAEKLGIDKRTFNRNVQTMREAGLTVGLRPDLPIYTEQDEKAISQWRETHPRGRPRRAASA